MLLRLLCLGILLLTPRLCLALDPWEEAPGGCRLDSWSDVERWRDWNRQSPRAANWAEEKSRYGNNREVWRWHDRLYISILDGKVLTLADCSFSDDTHYYEYARYDEPGGFHVVHVWRYEAHGYALVMRNTGKIYSIAGLPVWSPDKARFAYAVCSPSDGTTDQGDAEIGIISFVDNRPKMDAKAAMPCHAQDCKIDWDDDATVSAACEAPHNSGGKPWLLQLTRTDFGWASKTSND